jgi:ATP-dependent DNA helicase 2 subunit 1
VFVLAPGIFLDLMHLKKHGGFDISLFYRDIISIAEDEDLGVYFEESSKLEDLLRKVRAKETRKRVLSRCAVCLGQLPTSPLTSHKQHIALTSLG